MSQKKKRNKTCQEAGNARGSLLKALQTQTWSPALQQWLDKNNLSHEQQNLTPVTMEK